MKKFISKISSKIKTFKRKRTGDSDFQRWGDGQALKSNWDSRTKQLATLIPAGASVIEFGAGRLILKAYLPAGCSYTPSDLVDRGSGTVICDLNSETLPQFGQYDVAVFSGVLEYVNDVPRLISHLAAAVDTFIVSYATTDKENEGRLLVHGWVNDYSDARFVEIFQENGYHCTHTETWKTQNIYAFSRS